jgi:hypothetical protein
MKTKRGDGVVYKTLTEAEGGMGTAKVCTTNERLRTGTARPRHRGVVVSPHASLITTTRLGRASARHPARISRCGLKNALRKQIANTRRPPQPASGKGRVMNDVVTDGMLTSTVVTPQTGPAVVAAISSGEGQPISPADQLELLIRRAAELPEEAQAELAQSIEKLEKKYHGVSG